MLEVLKLSPVQGVLISELCQRFPTWLKYRVTIVNLEAKRMTTGEFILEDYLNRANTVQIFRSFADVETQSSANKINKFLAQIVWKIITRSMLVACCYVAVTLLANSNFLVL